MILVPETPRFLIKRDRLDDAKKSLSILRRLPADHPEIVSEVKEIKANHDYEMTLGSSSYKVFFSNDNSENMRKRLLTGIGIQLLQQLTGANFIFYYGSSFFSSLGIKNSLTVSLITNSVNVGSTVPALWLVEEWGRRNLLLFGAAGMFVCQLAVGITGTAFSKAETANSIMIASICGYVFCYAFSWGYIGEIFPLKSRAKGMSISTAANWLLNWLLGYTTPMIVDTGSGKAGLEAKVFFIWAAFCALSFLFAWTCVYETKGFTLEQIDELYAKVPHAWQSPGFEPTVNFADVAQEVHQDDYMSSETRLTLAEIEASVLRRRNSISPEPIEIRLEMQESNEKLTEVKVSRSLT
ncbi:High-affinity glucose transporter rgt2 [Orbilia brochopaga]|uniref:High-affinity glucose transporter rgt2 n=1 Tax=Orbilia brochopaga TaxID=3140254 RepID=A0AAV9UHB6_9PEZI